jgi:hypothetical protein
MAAEPDHTEDPIEHEPPLEQAPEQADPRPTPKRQEKINFHPHINGKKIF